MRINAKLLGLTGAMSALVWLIQTTACTGGDDSASAGAGNTSAAGSPTTSGGAPGTAGGSTAGGSTASGGSTTTGSCTPIPAAKPTIADFENYSGDGSSNFQTWSFYLGGDTALGVLVGSFSYGDRPSGLPDVSEFSTGHDSMYAMRIADADANRPAGTTGLYGGGMGLWQSVCMNATAFTGISFWVRGDSPQGTGTLTLSMKDTTTSTPAKSTDVPGLCSGTSTTCVHPSFSFPVADAWAQVKVPWSSFKAGDAAGTPVTPDGRNITQLQFAVGLNFVAPDGSTVYEAVPAPYELAVDDLAFY